MKASRQRGSFSSINNWGPFW